MLNVLDRRFSDIHLILNPVRVQGEGAEHEIAHAIDELNEKTDVDVIIIGRGGGSLEDLWAFNTEVVARSINRSRIPVISAVGHEIDWTISDYVADLRVPTPSAAAERVIIARSELVERLHFLSSRIASALGRNMDRWKGRVSMAQRSPVFSEPAGRLRQYQQLMDEYYEKMHLRMSYRIELGNRDVAAQAEKLETLSPLNVLKRGYSITSAAVTKKVVKNSSCVNVGEDIITTVGDGRIISKVSEIRKN